jgi:hypothetical protein
MEIFDIIWKFAVIGFLLAITLSLGMIKFKIDDIEKLLYVPEFIQVEPQDGKDINR